MTGVKAVSSSEQPTAIAARPRRRARLEVPATKKSRHLPASDAAPPNSPEPKPITRSRAASDKRPSALDAAAQVLAALSGSAATEGLSAPELIERMAAARLWVSPGGKTPASTLYAAMTREIASKGAASRFRKQGPGRFSLNSAPTAKGAKARAAAKPKAAAPDPEAGR